MLDSYIDPNRVQFFQSESEEPGSVKDIEPTGDGTVSIHVMLGRDFVDQGPCSLLVVDTYHRFLLHQPIDPEHSEAKLSLPISRLLNLSTAQDPIRVYLYYYEDSIALRLASSSGTFARLNKALEDARDVEPPEVPSYRKDLLNLIVEATNDRYVSRSIRDSIITGKNYQTLDLGETLRRGGRSTRMTRLRAVDFASKKVLDVRANTGEVSREIRRMGADVVDGIEYDTFFVETGRMINAYTGVSRVSLDQGDVTHPGLYKERYDIVVALSVFVYIKDVLEQLAKITDVLVFETHTLDHGLGFYLPKVAKYFPFVRHLGFTESHDDFKMSRALMLFTTKRELLHSEVLLDNVLIPEGTTNYYYADPARRFPDRGVFERENLEKLGTDGMDAFLERIEQRFGNSAIEALGDESFRFFSDAYWVFYLLGYIDYLGNENSVTDDNRFKNFYATAIRRGVLDQNLKPLLDDEERLKLKVSTKYHDIDHARDYGTLALAPIGLVETDEESDFTFWTSSGRRVCASNIDGHHRMFIAKLLNASSMPFIFVGKRVNRVRLKVLGQTYTLVD